MDMNMYEAIKGRRHYLPEQRVKYYMYQVLKSIDHMHRNGIFHRDIKPYVFFPSSVAHGLFYDVKREHFIEGGSGEIG